MIDILLERDNLTATVPTVSGDHDFCPAVGYAILDALGTEAAKDDAVNGTDAGACKHGYRGLRNQWHVDQDTVSIFDTVSFEDIGELADLTMKLSIGQNLFFTRLPFPDDRRLVAAWGVEMAV